MEQTTEGAEAPKKRPAFVTVLCILSFVSAGFAIFGYVTVMLLIGAGAALSSKMSDKMSDMGGTMTMTQTAGPSAGMTWAYVIVGFISTIIALMGVLKMWKLKKSGFYMYVVAAVMSIIMSVIYSGFGGAMFGLGTSALFIVLYGLNLKHMK
ncbi:MAG: hypothetical protein IAF38_08520 [Bacteroidia bacterium]|nr:hypothetical protein [Bacteroidia bacterium]